MALDSVHRFARVVRSLASVTAGESPWLRERWPVTLVPDGATGADEWEEMVALGADGLVVPNRGGRCIDGTRAIEALFEVVDAVGGRVEICPMAASVAAATSSRPSRSKPRPFSSAGSTRSGSGRRAGMAPLAAAVRRLEPGHEALRVVEGNVRAADLEPSAAELGRPESVPDALGPGYSGGVQPGWVSPQPEA